MSIKAFRNSKNNILRNADIPNHQSENSKKKTRTEQNLIENFLFKIKTINNMHISKENKTLNKM
jgi:hypothetical protein